MEKFLGSVDRSTRNDIRAKFRAAIESGFANPEEQV